MDKKVSLKNYFILLFIICISIFLVIYFYLWHSTYENNKLNTPILDDYLQVIQYNELNNYLMENKDAIIYVSVLNNEEIRDFEKKFRRIISKYSLNNKILYMDVTDINNKGNIKLENVPYIVLYKNGFEVSNFNIDDNAYDIDLIMDYLYNEGVINYD